MPISLLDLWLPVVIAAVLAHAGSFLLWGVLPWHQRDQSGLANEDGVRAALRGLTPGKYMVPFAPDPKVAAQPEMREKFVSGPVAVIHVQRPGAPSMGRLIGQMFVFQLVVSVFVAYVASRSLAPNAPYLEVFRQTATVAFLAYGAANVPQSIWWAHPWKNTAKELVDALVLGLLTAGAFGWLWPTG